MTPLPREDILAFAAEAFDRIALRLENGEIPLRPGADRRILRRSAQAREKAAQDQASCTATANIITSRHKVCNQ